MSPQLMEFEAKALKLPPTDRATLAERLIASLDNLNEQQNEQLWIDEMRIACPSNTPTYLLETRLNNHPCHLLLNRDENLLRLKQGNKIKQGNKNEIGEGIEREEPLSR